MDREPRNEVASGSFDKFWQACQNSREYPFSLRNPCLSNDVLEDYQKLLERQAPRLFDEKESRISIWEYWAGDEDFTEEKEIDDSQELHDHLQQHYEKDLQCRHVFIHAWNSRSPLDCSEDLLKKLLTFHEVAPFFLDDLVTFGNQGEQLDVSLSRFTDHTAYRMQRNISPLPELGRSGYEIKHSFLLRSAERADPEDEDPWPWRIRPCAAYHSFDPTTGRALWITAKANDVIQNKIMSSTPEFAAFCGSRTDHMPEKVDMRLLLEAALATHLIYFHWCEYSWRWFIREIDEHLNDKMEKSREIPIDCRPYSTNFPGRKDAAISSAMRAELPSNRHHKFNARCLSLLRRVRAWGNSTIPKLDPRPEMAGKTAGTDVTHEEVLTLSKFNCMDLQDLGAIHRRLEEARRACELNRQVLNDICDYYGEIAQSHLNDLDPQEKRAMNDTIYRFVRNVKAITKGFERSEKQLASLRTVVAESDIPLLESILQLRGSYASRMFAEAAHGISTLMQQLASRTADISWWGYIITFLVFVPFYSTATTGLLQSPIFDCQAETGSCLVNHAALTLFFEIAGPLTAVGLLVFWRLKTRARVKMESGSV